MTVAGPSPRPAYSRDSASIRLPDHVRLDNLSPDWAFGGATGRGVRVAVIDSGVEAGHPALGDSVALDSGVEVEEAAGGGLTLRGGPHRDAFGHGTACAGIIHSLAPQAAIVSVKVLGERGGKGGSAALLEGLAWAVEQRFEIINLSLGTTRRDWALALHELCDLAYFRGCFVVTAANNLPRASFPSLYSSVASVACNLATDPMRFHYNPEPPTEFLARGVDVEVPWAGGGTIRATGNSYAAPHIAGIAALIRSKHPALRPFQIKTALWAAAANVRESPQMVAGRISRSGITRRASFRTTGALASRPA